MTSPSVAGHAPAPVAAGTRSRPLGELAAGEPMAVDLPDELHLTFDAVAVASRRAMRANGLAL